MDENTCNVKPDARCNDSANIPSRRYSCIMCGIKGRRSNSLEDRLRDPVCPSCQQSEKNWADHYHGKLVKARDLGYLPDDFYF